MVKEDWKSINQGFEDWKKKEKWQEAEFDFEQTREWIVAGLRVNQSEIAAYAKWRCYQPFSVDVAELRREYYQVQNWLDYYYPLGGKVKNNEFLRSNQGKTRSEIKKLNINEKKLEGSLSLKGFINLEEFYCHGNKITSLKLSDCSNLQVFSCEKNELTHLDLTGLNKLTTLYCSNNYLTDLKLRDCSSLQKFDCVNNLLTDTKFLIQLSQPQKLEELNISDNDFVSQDLTFLTSFVNLRQLFLGSDDQKRIRKNLYNRFSGSLQPLQKLIKLEELNINNNCLEGSLRLENFTNLEEFFCVNNKITSLVINDCSQLRKINCYNNQLISLDVSKNVQLASLVCSSNRLTNLKIGKNNQLTEIYCWGNQLVSLDLSFLSSEKLKRLDISNNNFSQQNLSLFSKFVKLKNLMIGIYDEEKIARGMYNRFSGSLESLKNLVQLEELDISNTDINQGAEYLPDSIKEIYYSTEERPKSKLKEISWQLKLFESKNQKKWEEAGFVLEEIKLWMELGLGDEDYKFADYLRREKNNLTLQEISRQVWVLRKEYEKYKSQQFQEQIEIGFLDKK